ncbi:MAG: mechanosensitive ion channel [gamma proteobacterium symbiont of Taylorina sp.]|nr:mechanosensitive ion channel [gamma proteobacterium symbiont of Taylorina sp.]
MKQILFSALLVFLLSVIFNQSMAVTQKISDVVKKEKAVSPKSSDEEDISINARALESKALEELSDSTKMTLDEKKKEASNAVIESQKALQEKKATQNKVDELKQELEETQTKIKETDTPKSKADINQLTKKSRQLEKQYQSLQDELKINNKKAKKAYEKSSKQQDEITHLKEQLHQLEKEKSKRYSPRKKALIIVFIMLVMFIILFAKDKLVDLFDKLLIFRGNKGHSVRSLRARTFLRIFSWAVSILIIAIAIFFILELFGFDSNTTLAGAGVFSVAIGFGAQQFIKDIFSGLFIVLEGQYGVNDFVSIGQYSGNVEDINLRFTKLRNYDGNVIFVPNGDIHSVINYGKGYANSVINFYVDVNQDIDKVFAIIREVVSDLRTAPDLLNEMLGDVELLGINAFTATGIEVKFRIKSAPQSQWMVGREVRLALKQRFDLEGVQLFQYQYENQLVKLTENNK